MGKAICDHMTAWWSGGGGTDEVDDYFSMGVLSDGSYNVPENLYFSFPVRLVGSGGYTIVHNLMLSQFAKDQLAVASKELSNERRLAMSYLQT